MSLFVVAPAAVHAQALPSTLQVEMPDGVTLATDVWRPLLDATPKPVLLRRTPYGRGLDLVLAQNLVAAGYIVVSQDVRGRGGSGGEFEPFFDDKLDGKATIDWIAAQPWSTGRVGTYSASAEGIVQYMAMAAAPEALRCSHVMMATHDVYEGLLPGGAWSADIGTAWLTAQGATSTIQRWKEHEARDAYWDDATLSTTEMSNIDHPVFIVGGMFDIFSRSEVRALRELRQHVDPSVQKDISLVLGPWTHGGPNLRNQGELYFPENAAYADYVTDLIAYFADCLQEKEDRVFPAVRYYVTEVTDELVTDPSDNVERIVAQGEWRESETWPPPDARDFRLYVQADDSLDGTLPAASTPDVALELDPADPTPSLGGGNLSTPAGPYDQAEIDARPDVFVATTAPVTEEVVISGEIRAHIWATSATTDVDVIVRAEVLTPMGKAVALTDGIRRGRFREGYDTLAPLVPGDAASFDVELGPIALRLPPGYALRIAVSGASTPRYELNPGVAEPLADAPVPVATTLTIHREPEHPSYIVVPVMEGTLPGAAIDEQGGAPTADASVPSSAPDAARADPVQYDAGALDSGAAPPLTEARPDDGEAGCGCHVTARSGGEAWLAGLLALLSAFALRRRSATLSGSRSRR